MIGIGIAAAALAGAAALVWFGQRAMIYFPDRTDPGSAEAVFPDAHDITLSTSDGLHLEAWRIDPADEPSGAVVYLPGNGGNRLGRTGVGQALADAGFTTVLVDYRGYGANPGSPGERGLVADGHAALRHLLDQGFDADKIVLVGESIGTGVAVQVAADTDVAGVLLRSPYTSLRDVADHVLPVPIGWAVRDTYDTLAHIRSVTSPVTVLAGEDDTLIPPAQSRMVADAAPNLHDLTVLPGTDHNDPVWFGPLLAAKVTELTQQ